MVEDPGVANFALGLKDSLYLNKISCDVFATGISRNYLRQYKEEFLFSSQITSLQNCYDFIFYGTSFI